MKVISIKKLAPELYIVKYEGRNIFRRISVSVERKVIAKEGDLFTFADDGGYVFRDSGEETLKWMVRNKVDEFEARHDQRP